jgi:hypothetical protein
MKKRKTGSDKRMICLVCGNSTWREVEVSVEPKKDHHFHITDTTKQMIKERIAPFGTYEAGLRGILESYDLFKAWEEKTKLRQLAEIRVDIPRLGVGDYVPSEDS